ncbi:twin transmembrane helix small protein [Stutzerimonas azotifigens]|uniref:twin transmembrane helix small protein n=1 Tax=Stutzerimonas azotifigens TaxID=291995 RepID=UPI0003FA8491|nr:twin transmembrane helix small protein [Stutzerimonas azotifigens]
MLKAIIVVLLVAVLASLFSGLFFLVKDESRRSRVVTALFIRVTLTAVIVILIGWGFYSGELKPSFGF